MLQATCAWFAAVSGFAAAVLWAVSTCVSVLAPPETQGVGALLDGYLIVKDAKGRRIDLADTLQKQSKWNGYAAAASGLSAFFSALALLPIPH